MIRIITTVLFAFVLSGCVSQPPETVVTETHERHLKASWPDNAVIIDVRKRFQYELGHWPNAYSMPAHEIVYMDRDLKRRFALLGVNPRIPLVLVGDMPPRELAAKLKEIDIEDVRAVSIESYKLPMTREEPLKPSPKAIW